MSLKSSPLEKAVLITVQLIVVCVISALIFLGGTDCAGIFIFLLGFILLVAGILRKRIFHAVGGMFAAFAGIALLFGTWFEAEFPFSPTLWLASHTRINGTNMIELVRGRSGGTCTDQHWHHCTWCEVVYPHAPHLAVRVNLNANDLDFYLFDWNPGRLKLVPATVRTAKVFPELIPNGCVVEPLGVGMNPQLYSHDEPCRIVPREDQETNATGSQKGT